MENKDKNIFITSYNQQGGITANQVHIGSQQRRLDDNLKHQLINEIDNRFANFKVDKNCLINIFAPQDGEAVNFGMQIRDYLQSQGYNVWKNLSSYMGNVGLDNLDIGFKFNEQHKHLQLYINFSRR